MNRQRVSVVEQVVAYDPALAALVDALRQDADALQSTASFPTRKVRKCTLYESLRPDTEPNAIAYYVAIASGCLTTAFIMTQRNAAIRRIQSSSNVEAQQTSLPFIQSGERFATVGISHLTTSRRHLPIPPVVALPHGDGWELHGCVPWVTGGAHADFFVLGAVEPHAKEADTPSDAPPSRDGTVLPIPREYLFLVPRERAGIRAGSGMELLALTSSCTDAVELSGVRVGIEDRLHGPSENVMAASQAGGAGGLQTSALALGLAASAIDYLNVQSHLRSNLAVYVENLIDQWSEQYAALIRVAEGATVGSIDLHGLRKRANDLALQSTQAALAAAKGAGFLQGHPVSRWCREAMFFLVWSCPQPVAEAHLCSFANLDAPWS
jgi:alkylation response protein AidB-like acyl-CoA dehydrogenase